MKIVKNQIRITGLLILSLVSQRLTAQKEQGLKESGRITISVNVPGEEDKAVLNGRSLLTEKGLGADTTPAKITTLSSQNKTVNEDNEIAVKIVTSPASCGSSNGLMSVSVDGGTPPYKFYCTQPSGHTVEQNTGYFPEMYAGVYTITVIDSNKLESESVTVQISSANDPPQCVISSYNLPTLCSSFDGSITLSASGGMPPYTYSIDQVNYQASPVFSNLSQGFYYGTVKDAAGCMMPSTGMFLNSGHCSAFSVSYTGVTCGSTGSIDAEAYGDAGPYQYSLDGINYQTGGSFKDLAPGTYTIYCKDVNDQLYVYTVYIFNSCPNYGITGMDAACNKGNGSFTVIWNYGKAPYLFTIDGINYQSSPKFTDLWAGNYPFSVKDADGNIYHGTAEVFSDCPIVTAISTPELCDKMNGTITATGENVSEPSYSIDGINFQSSNVFTGLKAGDYTVTIKEAFGAFNTTKVTVGKTCFQVSLQVTHPVCSEPNGAIAINVTGTNLPFQYSLDGVNFQSSNIFNSLSGGVYDILISYRGTILKDTSVTLSNQPPPIISVTAKNAGCNSVNGSVQIDATEGMPPLQYSIDGNYFQDQPYFDNLKAGIYTAYVKDLNGCISKSEIQITGLPVPDVFIGDDTVICKNDLIELSVPDIPGYIYKWQDNSSATIYSVGEPGVYFVTVTNEFGCSSSDTIEVTDKSVPEFSIGNDTAFCGTIFTMELKPSPDIEGSYLWSTGVPDKVIRINQPGYYRLDISNSVCKGSAAILVESKPMPVVFLGEDTVLCEGANITLSAENVGASYLWQDGSAGPAYVVKSSGIYSVLVNLNGCESGDTINISYLKQPKFSLGRDTSLCRGQKIYLQPSLNTQVSYLWQDGSTNPYFNITDTGFVRLVVQNDCGMDAGAIYVREGMCDLYIPNAFSPNDDGLNDVFRVFYPLKVDEFHFSIFNRFGEKIFETRKPEAGWDGRFKGVPQPVGVYTYVIEIKERDKPRYVKTGIVSLIR